MQKDYFILCHEERELVMCSIHSEIYPDLLLVGYTVLFQGSKRECNAYLLDELEIAC